MDLELFIGISSYITVHNRYRLLPLQQLVMYAIETILLGSDEQSLSLVNMPVNTNQKAAGL